MKAIECKVVLAEFCKIVSFLYLNKKKLYCKGQPYWFSGWQDLLLHTDTQTVRQ